MSGRLDHGLRRHRHLGLDGRRLGLRLDLLSRADRDLAPPPGIGQRPGAPVAIHGGSVGLSGDLNTGGSDGTIISAGEVDVGATTGPVSIRGNVTASGRDGTGGSGNNVSLHGTDVRVDRVDASAGLAGAVPGLPATSASAAARRSRSAAPSTCAAPAVRRAPGDGRRQRLAHERRPGPRGHIFASGADGNAAALRPGLDRDPGAPSRSGSCSSTAAAERRRGYGATAAACRSPRRARSRSTRSRPTAATAPATAFRAATAGRSCSPVTASSPPSCARRRAARAATLRRRAGPIVVNGRTAVTILGGVYANGASANGNAPIRGGSGGDVRCTRLGARSRCRLRSAPTAATAATRRPAQGNSGGKGGAVDLVGTIDPIAGITTEGGDGGFSNDADHRGMGGNGGSVHAWSETDLFGTLRAISTAGGGGAPPGVDGVQLQDAGPRGSRSTRMACSASPRRARPPRATACSVRSATRPSVLTTAATRVTLPALAVCTPVTYQVQAYQTGVGWTSPATPRCRGSSSPRRRSAAPMRRR